MKYFERSMKSWRLKIVALTWLQGGHHVAPQYRNTGLPAALASANAASTSSLRQAIPDSSGAIAAGVAGTAAFDAGGLADGAGSGDFEQAASPNATSKTANLSVMIESALRARAEPADIMHDGTRRGRTLRALRARADRGFSLEL
jgi:hypothetical protein